jgi:hypothetical protein
VPKVLPGPDKSVNLSCAYAIPGGRCDAGASQPGWHNVTCVTEADCACLCGTCHCHSVAATCHAHTDGKRYCDTGKPGGHIWKRAKRLWDAANPCDPCVEKHTIAGRLQNKRGNGQMSIVAALKGAPPPAVAPSKQQHVHKRKSAADEDRKMKVVVAISRFFK